MTGRTTPGPTDVVISIDTEFSAGGTFEDPTRKSRPVGERYVTGLVKGVEQGLGFMLETFDRHDVSATFFVEVLHTRHFGAEPMGGLVRQIRDAGHDVQLHLHPLWLAFDGERIDWDMMPWPPSDSCSGRSVEELVEIMRFGIEAFAAWSVPAPVALRTGNFHVDRNVYRAQAAVGLPLASNVGLSVFQPDEEGLRLRGGRHRIEGVLEQPVLCFDDVKIGPYRHQRLLQISSTGWGEQRLVLQQARAAGAETVVILTHPFEFFKCGDLQCRHLRPNRVNQTRLDKLCAFIKGNPSSFRFATFRDSKEDWLAKPDKPLDDISISSAWAAARLLQNKLNELVWWY